MNRGAAAEGGQAGRRRLLLAHALALALASVAAIVCVILELALDPVEVLLPGELGFGMVDCRPPSGDRSGGAERGFSFFIDRFEVTVRDYGEFLRATGRKMPPGAMLWTDPWTGPGFLPATGMTYFDAQSYAAWRGKRLPTSGEWEWAGRGPNGFEYPWGEGFVETIANTAELGLLRPTTVGTFYNGRSQFSGAYDLVGNAAEWTASQVAGALEVRYIIRGGSFKTSALGSMDAPVAADSPEAAVTVGGADRGGFSDKPDGWAHDVGFRCVADVRDVEADVGYREALSKLGGRDPLRLVFAVRPAMSALSVPEAARVLERALELNGDPLVRDRIQDALNAGRR